MALLTLGAVGLMGGLSLLNKGISQTQQYQYDKALKAQQYEYDKALKEQQYGYDTQLATQKYGYDSALSAQGAQQELAKQVNQQDWEKMMSDTEMQRKIADYKEAGVNPALAMGGVSSTGATGTEAPAQTTPQEQKTNAKDAKNQMNAENMLAITNAVKAGVLSVATKKLNYKAKLLAKNPHNKKLEHSLKRDIFNYYNLIKA